MSETPLIAAQEITMHFGGLAALVGVDFEVVPREVVGLIGPNGSGKTTLFNVITGILRPTRGKVMVMDQDVTGWRPHRIARLGIGRTFQIPSPFAKSTVFENLMVAAGADKAQSQERARNLLKDFDLYDVRDEPAESLDSGHLRLLELARTMMLDPKVLLLDEPTSGIDPALLDRLLDHIKDIHAQSRAICIVAHDMRAIEDVCQRVIVLHHGVVIANGTFDEVRQDPEVVDAYLGQG
ncbi:MAG TPA: ABC transporter ATP-binding protein [Anaerolineales bacterium]